MKTLEDIPQLWIKKYVDSLIEAAKLFEEGGTMRNSILLRADSILDMVKAFRETRERNENSSSS